MKKYFLILFSVTILSASSCKKEKLVSEEKTYLEYGATGGSLGFGGIILTLKPDGKADLLLGGDTYERYDYTIKGKMVIIEKTNGYSSFNIKIISDTQLLYEKDRILILSTN